MSWDTRWQITRTTLLSVYKRAIIAPVAKASESENDPMLDGGAGQDLLPNVQAGHDYATLTDLRG